MINSNILLWGGIALAVLILIIIAIVVIGKKRGETKKVHFEKPAEEPKQLTQEQKSGNYQAKSGFNFTPANADKPKEPVQRKSGAAAAGAAGVAAAGAAGAAGAAKVAPAQSDERDATKLANDQLSGKTPTESSEQSSAPAADNATQKAEAARVEAALQETEAKEEEKRQADEQALKNADAAANDTTESSTNTDAAREAEAEQKRAAAEAEEARKLEAEQAQRAQELQADTDQVEAREADIELPEDKKPVTGAAAAAGAGVAAAGAGAAASAGATTNDEAARQAEKEQEQKAAEAEEARKLEAEQAQRAEEVQADAGVHDDADAARQAEQEQEQKAAEAEEARKLEAEQAQRAEELQADEPQQETQNTDTSNGAGGAAGAAGVAGAAAVGAAGAAAAASAQAEEESPIFDEVVDEHDADEVETVVDAQEAEQADATEEAQEAAAAAEVQQDAVERALEETPVPAGEPEPVAEPTDDIAPAAGRLGRLRGRLSRSQNAIGQGLMGILSAGDLDEDAWEEIEDTLIMADLGTKVTMKVTESLRDKIAERGVASEEEARAMLRETLIEVGHPEMDRSIKAMPNEGKPAVIMVVGVNGTGKTTTTGKLARVLVAMGHKVLLGAADTFRAAAADQLETWGRRVGANTVRGKEGADPASVAFDAVAAGVEQQVDVVLVDTAGRLHTSTDLMDQLGKVKRVVEKKTVVDEVLLVIDATVGQNGLQQARIFREVVDITGVVLTKLDGTAKGGIVFQVQEELGVPVKLVGLGEGADHLAPFEVESFVDALLGER